MGTETLLTSEPIEFPPCALCGVPYGAIPDEIVVAYRELENAAPSLLRACLRAGYICNRCIAKTDDERRRDAVASLVEKTYKTGLLPKDAVAHRFGQVNTTWRNHNVEAWNKAIAWKFQPKGLYISGDPGRGKTFMARCILNRTLDDGHSVMEVFTPEVSQRICEQDYKITVNSMQTVKLLLVDDLDKATWRNFCLTAFFAVIDARWRQKFPTIVTANYTGKALREKWMEQYANDRGIAGSLIDRLNCDGIQLSGPSIRMLMGKEINEEGSV